MSTRQRMPAVRSAPADQPVEGAAAPARAAGHGDPPELSPTRIDMSITPEARADMEENKRLLALASDRELLRHALSLQRWAVSVLRGGKRVFVTDEVGHVESEMKVEPVHRPGRQEIIFDIAPREP